VDERRNFETKTVKKKNIPRKKFLCSGKEGAKYILRYWEIKI
jgi:hypothetical protein